MANKLNISQLASIKGCTIQEVYELATSKGVALPSNSEYILTASQLSAIDPKLAWNIKYGRIVSAPVEDSDGKSEKKDEVVLPEVCHPKSDKVKLPPLKVVGKIDLSQIELSNQLELSTATPNPVKNINDNNIKKEKKLKSPKRIIGIVKFFDSFKGWGFVVSGSKGISGKLEDEGRLFSLHLTSSQWSSSSSPRDGEWIIFTPLKTQRGWSALNAERMEFNWETLLFAMKYRGKYAKIEGIDTKGDRYDEDILCQIIQKLVGIRTGYGSISYDKSKFPEVIDAFCEFIANMPTERHESTIKQFIDDPLLEHLLFQIFTEGDYSSEDDSHMVVYTLYNKILLNRVFETGTISDLSKISDTFDFSSYIDGLTKLLVTNAETEPSSVESWLGIHNILNMLYLDGTDPQTIPLRMILVKMTSDESWINTLNVKWEVIREYIKEKPSNAYDFCIHYFANKDENFIRNHKVADLLGDSTFNEWCKDMIDDEHAPKIFLRILMECKVEGNLDMWKEYVETGHDVLLSYRVLRMALSNEIKDNAESVRDFFKSCQNRGISVVDLMGNDKCLSDEMYVEMFVQTGDFEYLNNMEDFDASATWVSLQPSKFVVQFIKFYGALIEHEESIEEDSYIKSLGVDAVVNALKSISNNEQFQLLRFFPKQFATEIVSGHFADTKLFDLYIGEQWAELKSKLPYMVFDLESDGDSVREFAFRSGDYTHYYEDEGQLGSLIDEINLKPIVVGHRVKQWDLKVLEKYGNISPEFVWDTLEIEILLNPCRYAYSLHTAHNAKDDTELTDRLFWNQLFRLSLDEQLCTQLADFLPTNIKSILDELRQPNFSQFFKKSGGTEDSFYQNLHDIDNTLICKLRVIEEECDGKSLIIAPQRLWNRIAEHLQVTFIREETDIDYLQISEEKLKDKPLEDTYLQTVLLRFSQISKTPIVSNLAAYLRIQYFSDNMLLDYLTVVPSNIVCADLRYIDAVRELLNYNRIYFVGCELENRLNQYALPIQLRPADFWNEKSSIPMRLGGSSFTYVTKEDRKSKLFAEIPSDAANVWIERTRDGKYIVNYNFNVIRKLKKLYSELHSDVIISNIAWTQEDANNRCISLVRSGRPVKFDFQQKRVNSTSRYRSMYWMYQLALLSEVHYYESRMPIIYILENDLELDQVMKYAQYLGYYVPTEGSLISKLEKIAQRSDGLLVVSRDNFFDIIEKRLYAAYCFVWDQMAVEKHMMMWQNDGTVEEGTLNDDVDETGTELKNGSRKDTYQAMLLSLWPIYQYYSRFILANNGSSKMYILDSFLEDYHTLSSIWNSSTLTSSQLWNSEKEFNDCLSKAQTFFKEDLSNNVQQDAEDVKRAMDVILTTMVPERDGVRKWSDIQEKVLPEILSKKENYLISIPTGGGKSVLFQGPALYNASYTNRLSLVVTPLKALMQDQVRELADKGFYTNVDFLNGDRTYQETRSIYRKINSGELALLYVTPERFRSRAFLNALMTRMMNDKGLEYMIFDEAHCISQWGMEFRPEYLNVINKCKCFSETFTGGMCIAMFSATVTDMIYNQINETVPVKRLGQDNDKKIYNPIRSHIGTSFRLVSHDMNSRIEAIIEYIDENNIDFGKSRMLIFCKTRSQCEELAASLPSLLVNKGLLPDRDASERVGYFHAGLDADDRDDAYSRFKSDDDPIYILCATKAFGMGMDIPNIHYIIHLSPPNVLEDYLQEVGRAGRNKGMYQLAGFSENNPIPTVCLYSTEDIKHSREQLLQSMLSWNNLEEIRADILDYISNIQSIEKTKEIPVVVPNTLWSSSPFDFEHTDFKLGEYWLERMDRIKMGYLSPAHITVTIQEINVPNSPLLSSKEGMYAKLIESLLNISREKGTNTIQISPQKLAGDMSIHPTKVLDLLIKCAKYRLLVINQEVRCRVANTRRDEVPYMLTHPSLDVAFHIIINATEKLLQENVVNKEKTYLDKEIRAFMDTSSLDHVLKKVERELENGQMESRYYMPWYNKEDRTRNMGLSVAKNYKKDLMGKRFRQIFSTLLDIIPDVKCKSYIDREAKCVKQSILVEKTTWKDFLPQFKEDCLRTLTYIYESQQTNKTTLNWAEAVNHLELGQKGFAYFENIMRYLSGMAYIASDNLLPTGVEVFTTDISEQVILEETKSDNRDYNDKLAFDEVLQIRNLRLCVMDALTSKVGNNKEAFQELISAYFSKTDANGFIELLGKYYDENDEIWGAIRETAIKNAEEKMKDNPEQWAIYNENSNVNINVEAGPGSGKTHVLTMRCAKLIYRQGVNPRQILVLAYNRAVVIELKSRLSKLFTSLGLSRSASQLHVYTFHGLAKKVCGKDQLEGLEMNEWEEQLLRLLQGNPVEVTKILGDIKYILIDEFQDITQTRLEAMFELNKIYNHPAFFTIGDRDQSIYGFEKEESMDPEYYYRQLLDKLEPKTMSMRTNYRSFPKILTEASRYLSDTSRLPVACKKNLEEEPKEAYTYIYNNQRNWAEDFQHTISFLRQHQIMDVAVFFRTNSEVYHGYSLIRTLDIPNVRIRIQGVSECELFRKREIYAVIHLIEKEGDKQLKLENDETKNWVRNKVSTWISKLNNWDSFYLDFAYTLVLDYLDFAESDDERHTYREMAEFLKLSLSEDNPQLYKLYDKYQSQRILQGQQMNVVLTTMHKVKGLEFDAVIVTPSVASLPFDPTQEIYEDMPLTEYEKECIEEERRLLYVAFTRAKKFLMAYLGKRENAVMNMVKYVGDDTSLGICEKNSGLDNYNIGFNAGKYGFGCNSNIVNHVEKNAPVVIRKVERMGANGVFQVFNVICNGITVGQLSKSSSIRQTMEEMDKSQLQGFFVSDVFYWTYEDTLAADERRRKDYDLNPWKYGHTPPEPFAKRWCDEAKKQGFVFIVSISGYGN